MIKDKQLHDRLGIPQQTLQNWKNSDTYTRLLYLYLTNQDKERFEKESKKIADFYNYELLTPKEFSKIVEDNWKKLKYFKGYQKPTTTTIENGDNEDTLAAALGENGKEILLIRYAYAMSKKKEPVFNEISKMVEHFSKIDNNIKKLKIVYVSSTQSKPKYFDEIEQDITLINYTALFKEVSDKHLLIV